MKIQEASKDIKRRRNFVSSLKTDNMEENTKKMKKRAITYENMHWLLDLF